jgi:exosortase/archaeosortase family protein
MKRGSEIKNRIYSLILRYAILIIISLSNFWIFYFIFTPLTIYPVYFIFNLFFNVSLSGNVIYFLNHNFSIKIIEACVAGSAYSLLTILNLSVPEIKFSKRIKSIFLSFLILLVANILRIVILSPIYILSPELFDILHKISWYFLSVILVVGIWFFEVKKFKIKEIPIYSDLVFLLKQIKSKSFSIKTKYKSSFKKRKSKS